MALLTSIIIRNLTTEVSNNQGYQPTKNSTNLDKPNNLKTFNFKCFIHFDYPTIDSYIIVSLKGKETKVKVPYYDMAKRIIEFVELQTNRLYPSQRICELENELDKRKVFKLDFTFSLTKTISINIVFI